MATPALLLFTTAVNTVYRTVTIDNTGGAAKTGWPVQVSLTASDFDFADVESDGSTLEFRATDGTTELDYWRQDWDSVGETGNLWVKVPSIGAGATTTVRMYYGAGISDRSSIGDTFSAGIDFTDTSVLSAQMDDTGDITLWQKQPLVTLANVQTIDAGVTALREQDDIVYDPDDPNLGTNPERLYKFYFSTLNPAKHVYVLFSADGVTWGNLARCTLDSATFAGEDPNVCTLLATRGRVYRNDGTMYLATENSSDIRVSSSTDGIAWTTAAASAVAEGGGGTWDEALAGSPVFRFDGTNFLMGYEGIAADDAEGFGIATGTGIGTLAKSANNPLWTSCVVDSFFKNDAGDKIILLAHAGVAAGPTIWRGVTSNTDPTTWDNTDIALLGTSNAIDPIRNDFTLDNSSGLTRMVTGEIADDTLVRFAVSSPNTDWSIKRAAAASVTNHGADHSPVEIDGEQLLLQPAVSAERFSLALYSAVSALENNFEMVVRAKQEAQTGDDWASFGFGTGAVDTTLEGVTPTQGEMAAHSGYRGWLLRPDNATGLRLEEVDADGVRTLLASAGASINAADGNQFRERKLSYLSSGVLALTVGSSTRTDTDSTFLSGAKRFCVAQGQSTDSNGAKQTIDWVFVRKYDGVDPSVTVGSEQG